MNHYPYPPDPSDPELDEPGLSALYRRGATQTPPAELDRRILDQAQAALQTWPDKGVTPGGTPSVQVKEARRWLPPWPRLWDWTPRWKWPWGWSRIRDWPRRWGRPQYWYWPPRWPLRGDGRWTWRRLAIPLSSAAGILLTVGLVLRVLDEQSAMQGVTGMAPTPLADYQPSQPSQPSQSSQTSPPFPPSKQEWEVAAKEVSEEAIGLSAAARPSRAPAAAQAPAMAPTGDGAIGQANSHEAAGHTPDHEGHSRDFHAKAQAQAKKQAENQPQLDDPLAKRRSAMPMTDTAGALHQKSQTSDEVPQEYSEPPQLTDEVPQGFGELPQLTDESYQANPERWIEDIRQSWSSGQRDEAIRQLAAFRHAHPQYPLPEDLAFMH